MKKKMKEIFFNARAFMLVAIIAYLSGDSAIGAHYQSLRNIGIILVAIVLAIFLLLKRRIEKRGVIVYILCTVILISGMLINGDYSGFSMFAVMGIGICVANLVDFELFFRQYEKFILIISMVSILGIVWAYIDITMLKNFPEINAAGKVSNLLLTVVPVNYSHKLVRNYGIFREPAMFSIYIGLALLKGLFYNEKLPVFKCIIFLIALLLTQSMTGYIAVAFLICIWILYKKNTRQKVVVVIAGIIAITLLLCTDSFTSYVLNRMNRSGASSHSINSRIASITVNMFICGLRILTGTGAIKAQRLFIEYLPLLNYAEDLTSSNMVAYICAAFGGIFGIVFLLGLYKFGFKIMRSSIGAVAIMGFIVLLLCGEVMTYSSIIYVFIFYGWNSLGGKVKVEKSISQLC